ncbi:vWA domain-containing protein [Methyloceanibacter caenitepidi]|uniref:vWA domain-containing protein n=1 Tax=Methyloceanibacter caenitepidi TaxID=1384459 RepID=UPI000B07EA35|nr:VWA domain-containing protein [Methyloceanibacter caenitepidi]
MAILFGIAIVPVILFVGVAVDYGRAMTVRGTMSDAADAAALAIGSWVGLSESELEDKAKKFFEANYASTLSSDIKSNFEVRFVGDDIVVNATASVPTTFMRLANFNDINVGIQNTITKRQRNIELALVLDTTGSMGSSGKMNAMKDAAKKMVDDLFGKTSISDTLDVAVVPFAAAVNVGSDKINEDWLDKGEYPNMSSISKENFDFENGESILAFFEKLKRKRSSWAWDGCVRERAEPYELTDATPVQGNKETLFTPYLAPDEPDEDNGGSYNGNTYIKDDGCGASNNNGGGWGWGWGWGGGWGGNNNNPSPEECQEYTGKYASPSTDRSGATPNLYCPPTAITALSDSKSTVKDAINALQPSGNTVIPAGLLWGWRVLSPSAPFTEAEAYDEEERVKAIVLLTDGENNVNGGQSFNGSTFSAFGYKSNGHLGSNPNAELNNKTQAVCNNIKAKGIQIYTIGFRVNDWTTQNLLRDCATKPDMYYNSPSNSQLAAIFSEIAQGLSELRIAQ